MSCGNLKTHYSPKELLELSLSSLPNSVQAIIYQAKKNCWVARKRIGKGGGNEYALSSLPTAVQNEIRAKCLPAGLTTQTRDLSAIRETLDLSQITDKQLASADARIVVVQWYLAQEQALELPRYKAVAEVVSAVKLGEIPDDISRAIRVANNRSGSKVKLSARTLMSWVLAYESGDDRGERFKQMVPLMVAKRTLPEHCPWLPDFLAVYQTFSNVSITQAYRQFEKLYQGAEMPSIGQVRHAMKQLPDYVTEQGRKTGAQMRAVQPFIRRNTEVMEINECWVGDGHSFKAYVKNRENGMPYVPEVTAMIDVRTRRVVGWSVAESESVMAVGDALRHGILRNGCPNIYYSDNGRGQANKIFDADITGILPRLGIHHETGIAGNPQGRGIIERLWQSTLIPLAKEYESYGGKDADAATHHLNYRKLRSAMQAKTKSKLLTDEQKRYLGKVPEFNAFVVDVARCFEEYNHTPHRSLPKNPHTGARYSPDEFYAHLVQLSGFEPNWLSQEEALLLFRPEVIRKVQRAEVVFDNKIYFALALADFHGVEVRVAYDQHDPSTVIVKQMSGELICEAVLDGNKVDYMPKSVCESAKAKSLKAKIRRKQESIAILEARNQSAIEVQAEPKFSMKIERTAEMEDALEHHLKENNGAQTL